MVRAWYLAESWEHGNQKEPHMPEPPVFLGLEELRQKTGVEYMTFPAEGLENNPDYKDLKQRRNYSYEDACNISRDTLPNYDKKVEAFFTEHIHSDEEIRFVNEGRGYFDVRDMEDRWIRIEVVKDDLLVVPAGIFHRFTLDTNNHIDVKRLFVGEPVWTPINRPAADEHPVRKAYVHTMTSVQA